MIAGQACHRCSSPCEADDLFCPVCSIPLARAASISTYQAQILRCDGCGAALTYDVHVQAPHCGFCGSIARLETTLDPIEEADHYLPFHVPPEQAQASLRGWLGSLGWFRPGDLATAASVQSLTPLYWVGWTFDVKAEVTWTADTEVGAGRSAWAPHSGRNEMNVRSALVGATRGLNPDEVATLAAYYDLRTTQTQPTQVPGLFVERFDVPRSAARARVGQGVRDQAKQFVANEWAPGRRRRNIHVSVIPTGLKSYRFAFPAYVFAYRYKNSIYRALVHGQNAAITFGKAPYSWLKIALVVFGALALILLIVLLIANA